MRIGYLPAVSKKSSFKPGKMSFVLIVIFSLLFGYLPEGARVQADAVIHTYNFQTLGNAGAPTTAPAGWELLGSPSAAPAARWQGTYGVSMNTNTVNTHFRQIQVPVPESGTYEVRFNGSLSKGQGIGELKLDSQVLGRYDFYDPTSGVIFGPTQTMGKMNLSTGDHVLTITLVGKNDNATWYQLFPRQLILEKLPSELMSVSAGLAVPLLAVGEQSELEVSGTMSDEEEADLSAAVFEYESLDPNIVTVNGNGMVTAVAPGTGRVKVSVTLGGETLETEVSVSVISGYLDSVEMSIEKSPLVLGTRTLAAIKGYDNESNPIALKNAAVQFESLNPSVAEVSDYGMITAKAVGEAVIRVTVDVAGTTRQAEQSIVIAEQLEGSDDIRTFQNKWGVAKPASGTITIDGLMNDSVWNQALMLTNFVTAFNNDAADPQTNVRITYDSEKLYIGITGERQTPDEELLSEGFEVVLRPDLSSGKYYDLIVMLAEDQQHKLRTHLGPGRTDLNGEVITIGNAVVASHQGTQGWTAEVAIPLSSLGVDEIVPGQEWAVNVLRHRPGVQPLSSWIPIRNSTFTDNEAPGVYMLYMSVTDQGRMGRLFFDDIPAQLADSSGASGIIPLYTDEISLLYQSFTEKKLSLPESVLPEGVGSLQLKWRTPAGRMLPVDNVQLAYRNDRLEIGFTHPRMEESGLYQLEIILANAGESEARMAVVAFDSEHVNEAGERAYGWVPPLPAQTAVTPAEPSAEVQRLLDMIPEQSGIYWAGLPERPDLSPEKLYDWNPAYPDQLTSKYSQLTYPNSLYPENKSLQVLNAKGELVEYPYYEDEAGRRYFITAHLWYKQREYVIKEMKRLAVTDPLGAARLLARFAEVYEGYVPVYDTIWNIAPISPSAAPPNPYWGGNWNWWYHLDLNLAGDLAEVYAKLKQTDALDMLSFHNGVDLQSKLVEKMFKPSVEFVRSYMKWNTNMDYNVWLGLIRIGKAIDYPDYVHEAIEKIRSYGANHYLYDGFWKEITYSYHSQSTVGMEIAMDLLEGWSDPPGYVSQRTGIPVINLDLMEQFPFFAESKRILNTLVYPDGHVLPIQDTWAWQKNGSPDLSAGSFLLPAAGIARMTKNGEDQNQSQLYMTFGPKYGHNQWDPLNLTFYAKDQELLPDLGYTYTKYRSWTNSTLAHNTVVVDGKDMTLSSGKLGGSLEVYAPADESLQVMKADQKNAYDEVGEYNREPWYIAFPGTQDGYVLDLFRVSGGSRHEYTLQGDANREASFTTDIGMLPYGPYLLPPGTQVVEPNTSTEQGSAGGHYYAYMHVKDVSRAELPDGKYEMKLSTQEGGVSKAGMKILGVTDPGSNELFLGRSPSLLKTRTENVDTTVANATYTMPKMVLRREGTNLKSTFVTALEPYAADSAGQIEQVTRLQPDQSQDGDVAVSVTYGTTTDIILSSPYGSGPLVVGNIRLEGKMGFIRLENSAITKMVLLDGTSLVYGDTEVSGEGAAAGVVESVYRKASGHAYNAFVTSSFVPLSAISKTVIVNHPDGTSGGYKINDVLTENGKTIIRIESEPGFAVYPDGTSEMTFYPAAKWAGANTFKIVNVETNMHAYIPFVESISLESDNLNDNRMTLLAGDTARLAAAAKYSNLTVSDVTYEPGVWQSSNMAVAVVDNGLVTAVGSGKADITASFGGKTAVVEVSVLEDGELRMEGLSSPMTVHEKAQISLYAASSHGVVDVTEWAAYESGDSGVATVMNTGVVEAMSAGNTVITATYGQFQPAPFALTVRDKSSNARLSDLRVNGVTVAGFTADSEVYTVHLGEGTQTVPTVNAVAEDDRAAVVVSPAGSLPGTTTVTVTAEDGVANKTYQIRFVVDSSQGRPDDSGTEPSAPASEPAKTSKAKEDVSLVLEAGQSSLKVTREMLLGAKQLKVTQGEFVLSFSQEAIEEMLAQLDAKGNDEALEIGVSPNWGDPEKRMVEKAGQQAHAVLTAASPVYDFGISSLQPGFSFQSPLNVTIKIYPGTDKQLLGVYRLGDNGELEYMGGKLTDEHIEITVTRPGKLVVLAFDKSFADVPADHWAYRMLKEMAAHHLIDGVNDLAYEPDRDVTRAEFTALLARALMLEKKEAARFADVASSAWYADAVAAAAEAGIVNGVEEGTFAPNRSITREEMVVMMVRAYKLKFGSISAPSAGFADREQTSEWAKASLDIAASLGLISGRGANAFVPQGVTNRAEGAQAIYNLLKLK
ncbi:S-layer homology domain-containing protein [Paenibacillus contaminans]|nr:S-layer homology domain-containing protein [Paenibacillus contaminans]